MLHNATPRSSTIQSHDAISQCNSTMRRCVTSKYNLHNAILWAKGRQRQRISVKDTSQRHQPKILIYPEKAHMVHIQTVVKYFFAELLPLTNAFGRCLPPLPFTIAFHLSNHKFQQYKREPLESNQQRSNASNELGAIVCPALRATQQQSSRQLSKVRSG